MTWISLTEFFHAHRRGKVLPVWVKVCGSIVGVPFIFASSSVAIIDVNHWEQNAIAIITVITFAVPITTTVLITIITYYGKVLEAWDQVQVNTDNLHTLKTKVEDGGPQGMVPRAEVEARIELIQQQLKALQNDSQ